MKKFFLLIFLIFNVILIFGQNASFNRIVLTHSISNDKNFEGYKKYSYNTFSIYTGRNNKGGLEFVISNKNGKIMERIIEKDVMQFKPILFENKSANTTLIFIEYATEYSWGNEVFKIENGKFSKIGWINYAVVIENGESIADFCKISFAKNGIEIKFENVKLFETSTEKEIDGENIVFLIKRNKLKTIIKTNS